MIGRMKILLLSLPLEGYIWMAALIFLTFINADSTHFTFCPFHNLGIDFCPGCGLGRSIHYLLHFEFIKSFHAHPLGGFALIIILHRIFTLIKNSIKYSEEKLSY
jgi:Protein of unknown function (DUF2752)